jgi:hypothetical protein
VEGSVKNRRFDNMSMKELQQEITSTMKSWQKVEDSTVALTGQVIEKTENPIIRLVMEIIQRYSHMHYRVQQWIADSLENETITLTPTELGEVWELLERHIELERKSVEIAERALASLKGKAMVIQNYFLSYLLEDEKKHTNLLDSLDGIKKKMYPYG